MQQLTRSAEVAPAPSTATGRPFEIRDYTAAAERVTDAAREVHALIEETRELSDSRSATQRFTELTSAVSQDFAREVRAATDHAALRGAQLVVLLVGLLSLGAGLWIWLGWRSRRKSDLSPMRRAGA